MNEHPRAQDARVLLENARALVQSIEAENLEEADRVLDALVRAREYDLFQELGKLTRNLHDAIKSFQLDVRLNHLAESEIPDARERLNYVVTMTEQAANRTLNALDEIDPIFRQVEQRVTVLDGAWQRFRRREMDVVEFRDLAREFDIFMGELNRNFGIIRSHLSEVMMAQDFQDLTGQIIRRVIELVQELEINLVELVRVGGERHKGVVIPVEPKDEKRTAGYGPTVPTLEKEQAVAVAGQDEVDDLLSSLGF